MKFNYNVILSWCNDQTIIQKLIVFVKEKKTWVPKS